MFLWEVFYTVIGVLSVIGVVEQTLLPLSYTQNKHLYSGNEKFL